MIEDDPKPSDSEDPPDDDTWTGAGEIETLEEGDQGRTSRGHLDPADEE